MLNSNFWAKYFKVSLYFEFINSRKNRVDPIFLPITPFRRKQEGERR